MSHCLARFWFWPLSRNTNSHLIFAEMEQSFSSLECYTLWRNNRHKRQPSTCLETWLGPLQQVGVKVCLEKKRQCHWLDLQCQRFDGNDQKSITRSLGLSHWAWTNQSTWGSQKKNKTKKTKTANQSYPNDHNASEWLAKQKNCLH